MIREKDKNTKRVNLSSSIAGAIHGMREGKAFVHEPVKKVKGYKPTLSDSITDKISGQIWVKEPVKLRCIGVIEIYTYVIQNMQTKIVEKRWGYKWIEKFQDATPKNSLLDESFLQEYISQLDII